MYPLMIPTHMASGFQTEAIRDLEKHPPQLIVMVRAATSWLVDKDSPPEFRAQLDAWLKRDYSVVGGFVRKGTDAFWAEPLPAYQFADASLVLYQRNRAGN
jgi:hypothetical protein